MQKWYLYPPERAFYTTQTAFDFATTYATKDTFTNPNLLPLECTQYSGDVIYVPSLWGHSTLNIQQSIGVAHEFSVESYCME